MAEIKISELPLASPLDGSEYSEIVQGTNKRVTKATERTYFQENLEVGAFASDTDDLPEGSTNFYYTSSRFNSDFSGKTTTDLAEGTNLYYTAARFNTAFSGKSTTDLSEGSNLYFTEARVRSAPLTGLSITGTTISSTDTVLQAFGKLQNQITALVGGVTYQGGWNANTNSPSLATGVGTKGYYYVVTTPGATNLDGVTDWKLGDWAIFNGTAWEKVDNTDAVISVNGYTGAVTLVTTDVNEGTNLYYTNARGIGSVLTGYVSGAGTVAATDTILQAIQKLNANDGLAWKITGTSTLTGVATITSNTANQHEFNGTWTATANNQYHWNFAGNFTMRNTASDNIFGYKFTPTFVAASTSQTVTGVLIDLPTVTGGTTPSVNLLLLRSNGANVFRFRSTPQLDFGSDSAAPYFAASGSTGTTTAGGLTLLSRGGAAWQTGHTVNLLYHTRSNNATTGGAYTAFRWTTPDASSYSATSASIVYKFAEFIPIYNITSTATPTLYGIDFNPTETALTAGTIRYGLLIGGTNWLNGFNTRTPNVTVDINGGFSLRQQSPAQITSNQNDYAIGAQSSFRLSTDASRNITGLTGGVDGKIIKIKNVGSQNIVLTHQDAGSVAANRFIFSTAGNITLLPDGSIVLEYDATTQRWRDESVR